MIENITIVILFLIAIIVGIFLFIVIVFQLTPRPGAYLIKKLFDSPLIIKDNDHYDQNYKKVMIIEDLKYESKYQKNELDIFYPKVFDKKIPVLFWVHGGAYVGGDKSQVVEFATNIAADTNVAVVSINYQLAPGLTYPGHIEQINEAYNFIKNKQQELPMLDLTCIMFGGDSAGAQLALQYVTIQTNEAYAKQMNMKQSISKESLKGAISYCGPVDLIQKAKEKSDSRILHFFVTTVAWSLLGSKEWKNSPQLAEASLVSHVTKDFPPVYITDGNEYSFEEQGIELAEKLERLQVPVSSLFYQNSPKKIVHEYQFNYDTEEAKRCYGETVVFVKRYMK